MSEETPRTIPIFQVGVVSEQPSTDAHGKPRVLRGGLKEKATQVVETSVEAMSANMERFVEGMTEVLSSGARFAGEFEIDTVEVECFISGTGQFGLIGTGVEVQGGSTLKIIFTRKKEKPDD